MKKLTLMEDVEEVIPQEDIDNASTSIITQLIKSTWDLIDTYNGAIISLESNPEAVNTLNEIVGTLYINIGQLEGELQKTDKNSEAIESGKEDTEIDFEE